MQITRGILYHYHIINTDLIMLPATASGAMARTEKYVWPYHLTRLCLTLILKLGPVPCMTSSSILCDKASKTSPNSTIMNADLESD